MYHYKTLEYRAVNHARHGYAIAGGHNISHIRDRGHFSRWGGGAEKKNLKGACGKNIAMLRVW